jgi:hypothetical protein
MKIYYELFLGFNEEFDFMYTDDEVMRYSFVEPEEPRLMREIGVDYIVEGITERNSYFFAESPLTRQLLPEQIRVLFCGVMYIGFTITNLFCTSSVNFVMKLNK